MKLTQILREIKITQPIIKTPINIKVPGGAEELKTAIANAGEKKTFGVKINDQHMGEFVVLDGGSSGLILKSIGFDWEEETTKELDVLLRDYPSQVDIESYKVARGVHEIRIEVPYDIVSKFVSINGQPYSKSFYSGRKILKKEEKNLAPLNINIIDIMNPSNIRKDIIGITHYLNKPPKNNRLPRSIKGNAEIRGKKHPFTMYLDSGMMGSSKSFPYNLEIIFADTGEDMDFLVDLFREHNLDYEENMVDPENYYSIMLSLKPGQMNLVKYHGKTLPPDINAD